MITQYCAGRVEWVLIYLHYHIRHTNVLNRVNSQRFLIDDPVCIDLTMFNEVECELFCGLVVLGFLHNVELVFGVSRVWISRFTWSVLSGVSKGSDSGIFLLLAF